MEALVEEEVRQCQDDRAVKHSVYEDQKYPDVRLLQLVDHGLKMWHQTQSLVLGNILEG